MPHAAPPQSSSKKVAIGVGVLVVLIIATIIALLVFSGGDDDGATALATQAPAAAVDDQPPDATDPAALDDEALPAQDDAPDEGLAVVPAAMQGRIAFVATDDIWAATGGGADVENLTLGRVERPRQPAWRPGAEEVLVSSTGGLRLVEVGRDAPPTVVTLDDQHLDPAWDPAGEEIVFSIPVEGGGRDLAIMTLEGDAPRLLGVADALGTDGTPGNALRPAWAPDGDRIAFQAEDGSGLGIWVVPASSGPPQLVAGAPGARDFHPSWTPQGDLLFTSDRVSPLSIWLHEIATGVERRVASIREDVLDADVSPCGDWVAYQIGTDGSTRVGVHTIGGGSVEFGELPSPEGIEAMGDPSWAGQACP